MKGLSGLKRFLSGAGLLFFICACSVSEPDSGKDSFYINLNEYPLYARNNFDSAAAAGVPDLSDAAWRVKMPEERRGAADSKSFGLPDTPRRAFLSPFREQVREYTMLIPFTVSPEQFEIINGKEPLQPGIFLAALGNNWEIFFNGKLIKSEIHLDKDGQIRSGRRWRYISLPLDRAFFVPGTNILTFRVLGMPNDNTTGLWYERPYYIGDYETIRKSHDEFLVLLICGAYFLVGFYHFLIFLNRPKNRDNLYYCFFSILLTVYFMMRTATIYRIIPNSDITIRIEFISLYLLAPLISTFLEHLSFGKTLIINRIFTGISFFFAVIQVPLPNFFGNDLLYIWWGCVLFEIVYIVSCDILYVFYRDIRDRRKAGKYSLGRIFWISLTGTPIGNIVIGFSVLSVTAVIDVISSIYMRYGVVNVSRYGLFIFNIIVAVVLAHDFGRLFRRIDEMNVLLEKSNLNLESMVRERTLELEHQTEVAQSASQAKSVFLARMSHEIRTPLNAILGLSEVELQKNLSGETRVNLEKVYYSGFHLLEIVNDILDISKIESGNFEIFPAEYELSTMINDAIQLNIPRIGIKPIRFKLEIDETIPSGLWGDELRIKQILNNFLSNAFKYTEEGEVRLLISWERRESDAWLNFTVEDTGRGIKEEDLERLFSEYTQLEATAGRRIEGTGLGLSITRGLVEMMGGSITVTSEYGKGSIFRISLPQRIVDAAPIGSELAEDLRNFRFIEGRNRNRGNTFIRSHMPHGKVLVVDDLETNLDVMIGLLMPYGLKVDTVLSGREAVEAIRKEEVRYDLVFMDHMMPEMDGVEAARIIRNEIGGSYAGTVPIIMLTANAIVGNREMFLRSGFNDFISKPVDLKQLDAVLNYWIRDKKGGTVAQEAEALNEDDDPESRWLLEHQIKGLDVRAALTLYGNLGAATYISALESFAAHTPSLLEKMDIHFESSLPDYVIAVHGLKGASGAICAGEAAALAQELELAGKEGNVELVRRKHGELYRNVLELTRRITELLAEREANRPAGEKEIRPEPDRVILACLSEAAAGFNSNNIEKSLEKLEQYRYEKDGDLVVWLRERVENFDYEVICRRLEDFLRKR
jgi:signal transduction histidine kinase/CheY-like chemotaxis protein